MSCEPLDSHPVELEGVVRLGYQNHHPFQLDRVGVQGLAAHRVDRESPREEGEGEGGEEAESRDHDDGGLWLVSMGGVMGCLNEWWWVLERV
jgi:hypothetical protein